MSTLKNITAKVDEITVKRLLRCNKAEDVKMSGLIRQEIENCGKVFRPRIDAEIIGIDSIRDGTVLLKNGVCLKGGCISQSLAACTSAAVCVCTLGHEADNYIKRQFDSGDYLRGLTADTVAFAALLSLGAQLRQRLVKKIEGTGLGITKRLSPGDGGWELRDQKNIFECFKSGTGVTLNESFMMSPLKSATAVYGFGKGIGVNPSEQSCSQCAVKDCPYNTEKIKVTVLCGKNKTVIDANKGENLYLLLKNHGLMDASPCAGRGICGKCRVKILSNAQEPAAEDKEHLAEAELNEGIRLACRVRVLEPMEIAVRAPAGELKIITRGNIRNIDVDTPVTKKYVTLEKADISDSRSDLNRVGSAMGIGGLTAGIEVLRTLGGELGGGERDLTVTAYNKRLIDIEKNNTESECFGMAADIGTTTVVCYLVELKSGRTVDVEAEPNKQRECGADIISRIEYADRHENGAKALREMIVGQINAMTERLCERNKVNIRNIYDVSVAGNTTMIHFFLGLPAHNIAVAPFTPVTVSAMDFYAAQVGLHTNGVVSVIPGISGYVGGDITAGILECGITESDRYTLLLDLGTNGEMALGNKNRLLTCSAAAGPAFEGGNIKYGISAVKGAIFEVNLSDKELYKTIAGESPAGICGSGVLDAVSELVKHGVVNETGRMEDYCEDQELAARIVCKDGERQFVLENEPFISVTQKDVREVQLAKAAVRAGIEILLKEAAVTCGDIDRVCIAGGFGNFLDIESAVTVGLIPEKLKKNAVCVGNSAGAGARLYLLSKRYRQKAADIAGLAEYIELSSRADFQDYYIDSMTF